MKLQFSILWLLVLTTYLGVATAALMSPDLSAAGQANFYAWFGVLGYAALVGCGFEASRRTAFARGVAAFTILYMVATPTGTNLIMDSWADLPHDYVVRSIIGPEIPNGTVIVDEEAFLQQEFYRNGLTAVAELNFSLLFGLLGGCLAAWRYGRQESREQSQKGKA